MEKYNYLAEITNDIIYWMDKDGDPFDISQFENRDKAAEFLYNELWAEDSVTGNGGDYYDTETSCESYLAYNLDLMIEACEEFCVDMKTLLQHYHDGDLARYLDCTIRCYLLEEVLHKVLNDIWKSE